MDGLQISAVALRPPRDHREELLRFLLVGGAGYVLAMTLDAVEVGLGVSPYVALPSIFALNGLFNFTLNRLWSFPRSGRPASEDLRRFAPVAAASLVVNYTTLFVFHGIAGIAAVPAQALAIIVATPVGFLGQKLFSFRVSHGHPG